MYAPIAVHFVHWRAYAASIAHLVTSTARQSRGKISKQANKYPARSTNPGLPQDFHRNKK